MISDKTGPVNHVSGIMMTSKWEHFEHQADVGVRGYGDSPASAFEQTALAMMAVVTDLEKISGKEAVKIHCEADDLELLLVDWLNALIYEMSTQKLLFHEFDVELGDHSLNAVALGESVDQTRHQPAVELKGATYTALKVAQDEQGLWLAQTVVDV